MPGAALKPHQPNQRLGVIAALGAFGFWGLAPIYFKFLSTVPALEIIVHRIVWGIPMLAGFLLLRDGKQFWRRMVLPRRAILTLLLSGTLVATNWFIFVWAVTHDHILETSLGYFINPLVNVLLGTVILKERLSRTQLFAVMLAAAGTAYLAWYLGQPPWISLALAFSFGFYGLVRKRLGVGPMIGLLWETLLLAIPALLLAAWLFQDVGLAFASGSAEINWLLIGTGLVTVLPLVWFNTAAHNLTLTSVGFFQYIAPTLTFLLAVYIYGEAFTPGHKVAFTCIWISLGMVSVESALRSRRNVGS
ncbi:MAG: EamA family transporter RarD [Xanthomonadales bacterium]|nr:EamA family transporter RarD [Xanthomonadales bacterium]